MNTGARTCPTCGGPESNPSATQCRFCGAAIAPPPQAQAFGHGPSQGWGAPPPPYGGPQQPYPVQPFGGVQNWSHPNQYVPGYVAPNGWSGLFWIRLAILVVCIGLSVFGACVSAMSR